MTEVRARSRGRSASRSDVQAWSRSPRGLPGALVAKAGKCWSWRSSRALAFVLAVAIPARLALADGEIGGPIEALLDLKVLNYDRKIFERSNGRLLIGVMYRKGDADSERQQKVMIAAFQDVASKQSVKNMTATVVAIPYREPVQKALEEANPTVLYLVTGLEDVLPSIQAAAEGLKLPTLSNKRAAVEAGLLAAIVAKNDKPAIVINLKAARKIGVDFDANLLGLAEVIR